LFFCDIFVGFTAHVVGEEEKPTQNQNVCLLSVHVRKSFRFPISLSISLLKLFFEVIF